MSARRINRGVTDPCPHCGFRVRHADLGPDEAIRHPGELVRLMRVPLEDRIARRSA